MTKPRVLFLDEPTSGLDSYTSNEVCTCYEPGSHKQVLVMLSVSLCSMPIVG